MGAWDYGIFDDDTAYDFIEEFKLSQNKFETMRSAFRIAQHADYVEYDECHAVTVYSAIMDSILNHTFYRCDDQEAFDELITKKKDLPVGNLKKEAVAALAKVVSKQSELSDLWSDNDRIYPKWKKNLQQLIERLSK